MKAIVDENLCIGCGICEAICPDVFELEDGIAKVKVTPVSEANAGDCREAAESCPVEAISIED